MSISLLQLLSDASTSSLLSNLAVLGGALLVGACGCGRGGRGCGCGGGRDDDDSDKADEDADESADADDDLDAGADFNLSAESLREYDEFVAQTDARIAELTEALENGDGSKEIAFELIQAFLTRAARKQEEEEFDEASDDYSAAFDRADAYREEYGESNEFLKTLGAARLNYAILLNDAGELEEADAEYRKAAETTERLVALGDREAKLDAVGILLNRAAILFEVGRRADSLNMLDEAIDEFQKLADANPTDNAEALFYLAKALSTKADFLRASLDEDEESEEASELSGRAIDVYRRLIGSGNLQYRRDLADALVARVATTPTRSQEDGKEAIDALQEARRMYEAAIACGEHDACVDLFDATMRLGELLVAAERTKEAIALYDGVVEDFAEFAKSDELPLLEGIAVARQRRALLRKEAGKGTTDELIADLSVALDLQARIADDLIETLRGEGGEHSCGCGHCGGHSNDGDGGEHSCGCGRCGGHSNDGDGGEHSCGCGGRRGGRSDDGEEHTCGCGGHSDGDGEEHSCGCGGHCGGRSDDGEGESGEHSCGCGRCGGDHSCDGEERKFFIEKWATDNFNAMLECFYERACAYLEKRDSGAAASDCLAATALDRAYREVLREGESLTSDWLPKLRALKESF